MPDRKKRQQKPLLSIVVPVYNEQDVLDAFYGRVKNVVNSLEKYEHELIFVDDGSEDKTYEKLQELADRDNSIRVLKFSRNFGHQVAITAGIKEAKGEAVVVIDADLQDPPEVITKFVEKWQDGFDVVYGVRERRQGESKAKLITASTFYRLLKMITRIDIPVDVGDFRLMSRRAVEQFNSLRERDRFVRGLVSWIGFKQTGVMYARDSRYAGETKFPYRKMFKFAFDGITSFSNVPLKVATWLGYLTSLLAFLYGVSVFIQKLAGITVQGWATIMFGMLFLGGVQLICLGIIGEYIARIFNEIKHRPLYILEETYPDGTSNGDSVSPKTVANTAEKLLDESYK